MIQFFYYIFKEQIVVLKLTLFLIDYKILIHNIIK